MRTAVLLLAVAFPLSALATPAGISGFSGKGGSAICTSCHSGAADPTVTLVGPASLGAGATGSYTVTISGGAGVAAGMDAALSGVNSGSATFTAGAGTRLLNGELVHSAAKLFAAGSAAFSFEIKAPLTAGPFTLTVAGLSSDSSNDPNGDGAATTALTVTVGLTGSPDAGGVPAPGAVTTPAPTGNRYNPSPQSKGVIEGESGCSSSGGMPMVVLIALVGGALLSSGQRRARAQARSKR